MFYKNGFVGSQNTSHEVNSKGSTSTQAGGLTACLCALFANWPSAG
jgi:hypothetical protein